MLCLLKWKEMDWAFLQKSFLRATGNTGHIFPYQLLLFHEQHSYDKTCFKSCSTCWIELGIMQYMLNWTRIMLICWAIYCVDLGASFNMSWYVNDHFWCMYNLSFNLLSTDYRICLTSFLLLSQEHWHLAILIHTVYESTWRIMCKHTLPQQTHIVQLNMAQLTCRQTHWN